MLHREAPIGVFDSGVGGLTVVREMLRQMPGESISYFADTAHVPYGPRDPQELRRFAAQITAFLVDKGCKMIIMACNTSTSLAYYDLKAQYDLPMVGVIEPGVDKALEHVSAAGGTGTIGVIGTKATIDSGVYQRILAQKNSKVQVAAVSCPPFVPLVESGQIRGPQVEETVRNCLGPLKEEGVECLLLGCTHYPFLAPVIKKIMGPDVSCIDPAIETVNRAYRLLAGMKLLNEGGRPSYHYYASGDPESFRRMGAFFLGHDTGEVKKIILG